MYGFNNQTFAGDDALPHPRRRARRSYRKIALMLTLREEGQTSEEEVRHVCAKAKRKIALALMSDPVVRRALAADADRLRA